MKEELKKIGLTGGEIRVYLALFDLGLSTKTPIAKKSEISQSKVYEVLDRLKQKGLVAQIIKNNIKHYQAELPSRLQDYVDAKKENLMKQEQAVKEIIPFLQAKQKANEEEYSAVVLESAEGLITSLREMLEQAGKGEEYLAMGIQTSKGQTYNDVLLNWHNQRIKRKISSRLIFSDRLGYHKNYTKMPLTKIKFLEKITPSSVGILGNKMVIATFGDKTNFLLITSKQVTDSFREFFESLWKQAKK